MNIGRYIIDPQIYRQKIITADLLLEIARISAQNENKQGLIVKVSGENKFRTNSITGAPNLKSPPTSSDLPSPSSSASSSASPLHAAPPPTFETIILRVTDGYSGKAGTGKRGGNSGRGGWRVVESRYATRKSLKVSAELGNSH
ncbi:hypothetical protein GWI33_013115 [Rhynchophorus ferrugineus]|uniref:Uncharacterized protein n=1 Tax=Rhynchophorus ferrugineus TaxID=354439 RepID=A0A834M6Y2_RHYFE|nr:hypothetical protein GWI33_013115 [Rhynchophorus ferrugineus]